MKSAISIQLTALLASHVLLAGLPGNAVAVGRVSLSWHACSPIVSDIPSDGAHPYSAFVSVIGQSEPHKAYQWYAYLRRDPWAGMPDAWRFDTIGCQTSGLIRLDHMPTVAMAKSCPAFQGSGSSLQIKDFSYSPIDGRSRIVLANSYPAGVVAVDPNVRYFLGRVEFDHTYSVVGAGTPSPVPGLPPLTCGGFEADMLLSLLSECNDPRFCDDFNVRWLDLQGVEHLFELENPTLTFCGSCAPTPALPTTWGQIKGQYRR